jgi:hypothetical protein
VSLGTTHEILITALLIHKTRLSREDVIENYAIKIVINMHIRRTVTEKEGKTYAINLSIKPNIRKLIHNAKLIIFETI